MKSRIAVQFWLLATLVLAGCPKSNQGELGGETNWLRLCSDRDGCGAGSCVCGVCTTECESTSRCSGSFAGSCVATASPLGASACAEAPRVPQGLCLPGCSSNAECGTGFACRDSVCVTDTVAVRFDVAEPPPPADQEASVCRSALRCDHAELCDWATARAQASDCFMPGAGPYATRCDSYDSIVSQGTDSATYYYYGADGTLVGTYSEGLVAEPGCVAYDPAFKLPASCEPASARCPMDAGETDAGSADAGATDAGTPDTAAPLCDCSSEEVSLACVCGQSAGGCDTFEQALTKVSCGNGPEPPSLQQGCGYKYLTLGGGGARNFLYQGVENTLVGALIYIDTFWGTCSRAVYKTQLPDLRTCADYSICDLCQDGGNPCQL